MTKNTQSRTGAVALAMIALSLPLNAEVIHRYSFGETSGTTVKDSVGTADGQIKGNGIAFDGSGRLYLSGMNTDGVVSSSSDTNTIISGYVDLPNHIINVWTNVSMETWVEWDAVGSAWQRIFDFGTSAGGENVSDGNGGYLFLSPQGNVNIRFAVRDPATGTEPAQATAGAPLLTGVETHLAVAYNYTDNYTSLYSNGVVIASAPAPVALSTINDVNNWLGRSQWGDPMFQGYFNEFRIYNHPLNALEVNASYLSGPDKLSTDLSALGTLQGVHLKVLNTSVTQLDTQAATSTADFAKAQGLSLTGVAEATYQSDNTNVVTITAKGDIVAVGVGTANLTVSFQGKSDSVAVNVNPRMTGVVVAGTLYVDLRASDAKNDATTWVNRTNGGNFTAVGTPTYDANVGGTGIPGIDFDGASAYLGPLTTSDLDGSSDRSIEVWAYDPQIADEETLVELGHRGTDNSNCSFGYGANATWGAVGQWGSADTGWTSGPPPAGLWHYLVYTYDGGTVCKVYADGRLKTNKQLSVPLTTFASMPIRIAAQGDSDAVDFDFAQALTGSIGFVRVHGGKLSDADVTNNFFYGMELSDPGSLQSVSFVGTNRLYDIGATVSSSLVAQFANRNYLSVNAFSTFTSSDTNIISVDAYGTLTALKLGSAVITGNFRGKTASQTFEVGLPAATLIHRYSFSDAVGSTTVKDSAGQANGTIQGNGAVFDGNGHLSLPGGTSSADVPVAGYVDLPNHIINVLTNVSIETWVTWQGSGSWQRIFDFGTSSGGEDSSSGNGDYLFLSPAGSTDLRFAVRNTAGTETPVLTAPAPLATNVEVYLAVTYNYSGNVSKLYSNGVMLVSGGAATALNSIDDVNNWLGRSQWGDPMFQGTYNEFRIYDGVLSASQIAADYQAGPDKIPTTPVTGPQLGVGVSNGKLVITWPDTPTGFQLQSTPQLGTNITWTTVDISTAVDQNGKQSITLPMDTAAKFYRLKK